MLSPPAELNAPSPRLRRVLGVLWLVCLGLAVFAQAGATWRVYVGARDIQPPFASLGLAVTDENSAEYWGVRPASAAARRAGVRNSYIHQVNGRNLALGERAENIASMVDGPDGGQVTLGLTDWERRSQSYVRLTRAPENRAQVYRDANRTFVILSQFIDVPVAVLIMFVAFMLRRHRFQEPVAILLSFALLFMAAVGTQTIWWWLGLYAAGPLFDLAWLALLLVASPAFPSGRYAPGWTRWFTVAVPAGATILVVTALAVSAEILIVAVALLNAILLPVALLCVILRFRSTPAGAERQQMKWATLGLGAGLFLYAAGQLLDFLRFDLPVPASWQPTLWIVAYALSRLSYVIIALGLLAPLLDYRLNDADTAIGRSAGYAAVTTLVAVVWAGSNAASDALIKSFTGANNAGLAAGISTLIALAILAPARTRALAWTEAYFQRALVRLRSLPERIARWQLGDDPGAVADRALKAIADGVDATDAALVARPVGEEANVIGVHNLNRETVMARLREGRPQARGSDAFPLRVEMADYAGPAMTLLIGRRSDGASYTRQERAAVSSLAEPLADALYAVSRRAALNATLTEALAEIRARLNQLYGKRAPRRPKKPPGEVLPSR